MEKQAILVVDDERDIRTTLKTLLTKAGYAVVTAVDVDDAFKKLETQSPDLVLLDVVMPGTPVHIFVAKVTGPKIIYLTAVTVTASERKELMKRKNVKGFINKPFDPGFLLKTIKRVLG